MDSVRYALTKVMIVLFGTDQYAYSALFESNRPSFGVIRKKPFGIGIACDIYFLADNWSIEFVGPALLQLSIRILIDKS